MKTINLVLRVLFGLMFLNAGLNKFFNYMPMPKDLPKSMIDVMGALSSMSWFMPLVGVVEVIGGVLIILPKTRALGAIICFPIMVGILFINIFHAPSGLPIAGVLTAINLLVIFENRGKYAQLIR